MHRRFFVRPPNEKGHCPKAMSSTISTTTAESAFNNISSLHTASALC